MTHLDAPIGELPLELHEAFAIAEQAWWRVEAAGFRLHFTCSGERRVSVAVHDLEGRPHTTISGLEAVQIAAGTAFRSPESLSPSGSHLGGASRPDPRTCGPR